MKFINSPLAIIILTFFLGVTACNQTGVDGTDVSGTEASLQDDARETIGSSYGTEINNPHPGDDPKPKTRIVAGTYSKELLALQAKQNTPVSLEIVSGYGEEEKIISIPVVGKGFEVRIETEKVYTLRLAIGETFIDVTNAMGLPLFGIRATIAKGMEDIHFKMTGFEIATDLTKSTDHDGDNIPDNEDEDTGSSSDRDADGVLDAFQDGIIGTVEIAPENCALKHVNFYNDASLLLKPGKKIILNLVTHQTPVDFDKEKIKIYSAAGEELDVEFVVSVGHANINWIKITAISEMFTLFETYQVQLDAEAITCENGSTTIRAIETTIETRPMAGQ